MKKRWLVGLTATLLCLAVCLSAAWVWSSLSGFQFEAGARISLAQDPFSSNDDGSHRSGSRIEDRILNPDVVSAAAGLLADRGIPLSLESPFDSVTDYLLDHTHVIVPDGGDVDDVRIVCRANNSDEAVQMVTALVDAGLAATRTSQADPPVSRSDDTAAERRQLADAIVRQQQSIEEMAARLQDMKSAGQPQDDPVVLETELVSARRTGSEAQQRLAEARRDFETQVAAEVVAARIVSIPVRTRALERLNLLKLQDELARQESQRQKWSSIYGRNHPKMIELRQKIDSLQQEVAGAAGGANPDEVAGGETSPASIVLKALEAEAAEFATVEQNLQTRRDAVLARLATQQELETRLAETRQELAFLHGEHDRLKRQIDSSRNEVQRSIPKVIEPPSITTGRSGPRTGLPMAVACVAGMLLCLLILWQFRRAPAVARPALASVPTVTLKPVSTPRRERFRSPAEEQLMRLKMLSVHADADR